MRAAVIFFACTIGAMTALPTASAQQKELIVDGKTAAAPKPSIEEIGRTAKILIEATSARWSELFKCTERGALDMIYQRETARDITQSAFTLCHNEEKAHQAAIRRLMSYPEPTAVSDREADRMIERGAREIKDEITALIMLRRSEWEKKYPDRRPRWS